MKINVSMPIPNPLGFKHFQRFVRSFITLSLKQFFHTKKPYKAIFHVDSLKLFHQKEISFAYYFLGIIQSMF